ncbi:hypothetical protein JTB14_013783 [Gonioctena quinquepunctata]|nr:hypothetical protein JTB14_013783 [Gonioctena quinquepunctata]
MFKIGLSYSYKALCARKTIKAIVESSKKLSHNVMYPPTVSGFQQCYLQILRFRSKSEKSRIPKRVSSETESEEETNDIFDDLPDKHTKTLKIKVLSMRMDAILKAGLGLSRNKIETIFYESKVRLNGDKVPKKSVSIREGDEVDVIKGVSVTNPEFLAVSRLEVLSAEAQEESISVKIRVCKSLTVENYPGRSSWLP